MCKVRVGKGDVVLLKNAVFSNVKAYSVRVINIVNRNFMNIEEIENQIELKRKELSFIKNPERRSELQRQLSKLGLRKEIEFIKNRIASMQ